MNRPIRTQIMGCSVHHITEDATVAQLWEELLSYSAVPTVRKEKREEKSDERYKRIWRDRKLALPIIERNATLNRLLEERAVNINIVSVYKSYHYCQGNRQGKLYWRTREGWNGMTVLEVVAKAEGVSEIVVEKYEGDIPMNRKELPDFADSLYEGVFEPTLVVEMECDHIIYDEYDWQVAKLIGDARNDRWFERLIPKKKQKICQHKNFSLILQYGNKRKEIYQPPRNPERPRGGEILEPSRGRRGISEM